MRNSSVFLGILAVAGLVTPVLAQIGEHQTIAISAIGKIAARPASPSCFQFRASAPLAADALAQNNRKFGRYRPSSPHLATSRTISAFRQPFHASRRGTLLCRARAPHRFDVFNNFYVYLDGQDLKDAAAFNAKVAAMLDELSKIGAGPINGPMPVSMAAGSVVVFTVKSPESYEKQAYQQALDKARPLADDVARGMKVQITGIDSVFSSGTVRSMMPGNPMDDPLVRVSVFLLRRSACPCDSERALQLATATADVWQPAFDSGSPCPKSGRRSAVNRPKRLSPVAPDVPPCLRLCAPSSMICDTDSGSCSAVRDLP